MPAGAPIRPDGRDSRANRWFQAGDGIARDVITADIQRYLGRDALVRPGADGGVEGYWITAYRNLTSEMVADLKHDSLRWRQEREQGHPQRGGNQGSRQPERPLYEHSETHEIRRINGPTQTPAPMEPRFEPPPAQRGFDSVRMPPGYDPQSHGGYAPQSHGGYAPQNHGGYAPQSHGGYDTTPTAYGHPGYSSYPAQHAAPYNDSSALQSPNSVFSHPNAPTPSAYSSASGYSSSTAASSQHQGTSPTRYVTPQEVPQYTISGGPQPYGENHQPRSGAGTYDAYAAQADARGNVEPYYRTGQGQPAAGYGYNNVQANSGRDTVLPGSASSAFAQPPLQSHATVAGAPYDQYGRTLQPAADFSANSRKRAHENGGSGGNGPRRR